MKIHFVTRFTDGRKTFEPRQHYEVEKEDAGRYIAAGVARKSLEPLEEFKPLKPASPAPLKEGEKVGDEVDGNLPSAKALKVEGVERDALGNVVEAKEPAAKKAKG